MPECRDKGNLYWEKVPAVVFAAGTLFSDEVDLVAIKIFLMLNR